MPHQCVHCGKLYQDAAPELLKGCSCGSNFFFYIKKEKYEQIKNEEEPPLDLSKDEKKQIEKDVRDMIGVEDEKPVVLDLESIKVLKPGKFKIDIVNLFSQKRPLIYKLEEGKYIIDLATTLKKQGVDPSGKIVDPSKKKRK